MARKSIGSRLKCPLSQITVGDGKERKRKTLSIVIMLLVPPLRVFEVNGMTLLELAVPRFSCKLPASQGRFCSDVSY